MTKEQAWAAFTSGGAYAGFGEDRFGGLRPGLRADFIVVDRDPVDATPEALRQTKALQTWVGGEQVWPGRK